jgi:hypothetical protein
MTSRCPSPIVLITIDADSRLSVMRTDDVMIGFVDERVNTFDLIVLPAQPIEIHEATKEKLIISVAHDVEGTAANVIAQLLAGKIIVAEGPKIEEEKELETSDQS